MSDMAEGYALAQHRRSYIRIVVNAPVILVTGNNLQKQLKIVDLSPRGLGIIGDSALNVGEKVKVVINLPFLSKQPFYKQGIVIWSQKTQKNLWRSALDFGEDSKINLG